MSWRTAIYLNLQRLGTAQVPELRLGVAGVIRSKNASCYVANNLFCPFEMGSDIRMQISS